MNEIIRGVWVGAAAPEVLLLDHNSEPQSFAGFWRERRTVFVFLRHFGCPHCRAQAVMLRQDRRHFEKAQVTVVLIGLGTPALAQAFRKEFEIPFPVLADATKAAYQTYGLVRMNMLKELAPAATVQYTRDMLRFGLNAIPKGQDMRQLGGVFIADRDGTLLYTYRSSRASEYPTTRAMLTAITTVDASSVQ